LVAHTFTPKRSCQLFLASKHYAVEHFAWAYGQVQQDFSF
jgi:hypothetical protein